MTDYGQLQPKRLAADRQRLRFCLPAEATAVRRDGF
jgi:hypothetical protein